MGQPAYSHCLIRGLKRLLSVALRSDCTDTQAAADLELHCLHISEGSFSLDVSYMLSFLNEHVCFIKVPS